MSRTTSYGILILNEHSQLLVAHVTGQHKWDIPKGRAEPGESPTAAAVRETFEETGIVVLQGELEDLGKHAYVPKKDLHLFRWRTSSAACNISACVCTSYSPHYRTGRPSAEVDAFRWVDLESIDRFCSPKLTALILPLLTDDQPAINKTRLTIQRQAPASLTYS